VRDAKIKVLAGLPVTTKEEREDWEKLGETLKVSVFGHLVGSSIFGGWVRYSQMCIC
jgi:hypothetical protein